MLPPWIASQSHQRTIAGGAGPAAHRPGGGAHFDASLVSAATETAAAKHATAAVPILPRNASACCRSSRAGLALPTLTSAAQPAEMSLPPQSTCDRTYHQENTLVSVLPCMPHALMSRVKDLNFFAFSPRALGNSRWRIIIL